MAGALAGCSGDVSTAALPSTASGPTVCAMLSRADVETMFGTDDFTVEDPMVPLDHDPTTGELSGGGCVLDGDDLRLHLVVAIKLGENRTELAEQLADPKLFGSLPGLRRFSAGEGLGGVYRYASADTNVAGVLLRGDYQIEIVQLTGIPEERDRLADARALILQAATSLGIPLEPGSPRPTIANR